MHKTFLSPPHNSADHCYPSQQHYHHRLGNAGKGGDGGNEVYRLSQRDQNL